MRKTLLGAFAAFLEMKGWWYSANDAWFGSISSVLKLRLRLLVITVKFACLDQWIMKYLWMISLNTVTGKLIYFLIHSNSAKCGFRYYMTLMRGDLQLRQGDTVYVLRDIPIPGTDKKHTYETIGKIDYSELDIFRIERLWKDKDTGKRFAYGHHYLRPHETFHEPTRKYVFVIIMFDTKKWLMSLQVFP